MNKPKFLDRYSHADPIETSDKPSMTDPQFLKETDIHAILKGYAVGVPLPVRSGAQSLDCTQFGDFAKCMEVVKAGSDAFMALPSALRAKFGHDPKAYYDFVNNPDNVEEMVKLGLAEPRVVEQSAIDVLKEISQKVTPKGDN